MIMGRRGRREDKCGVKKGPWSPEEDKTLVDYIKEHGHGSWRDIPKLAGLNRCEKSCRLRWTNYLRPNIKRGRFSDQEQQIIINLHALLGNKWSTIASHLPGRTDNDIKNLWNTHLRRKLVEKGLDPITHDPIRSASASSSEQCDLVSLLQQLLGAANIVSGLITNTWDAPNALRLNSSLDTNNNNATVQQQLAKLQMLQNMLNQVLSSNNSSSNPAPNNNNPLYEALGFNNNNDDGSTDALFPCCATQNQTSFQNFEQTGEYPTPPNCSSIIMKDDEQIVVLDATTNNNNNNNNSGPTNTVIIPFNLFPKLVSASSPQCSNAANNNIGISNNNNNNPCSSTPTTFKTWASSDFMYEEARDQASYYWKEIMDQDSNQP